MMTDKEKKQYGKELKDFRKNGYVKTTAQEDMNFDLSKTGNPNVDKKKVKSTVNIKKVKK